MSDTLTYFGALKILGQEKSRLVMLLDGAATAGLTAWAAGAWATGKDSGAPLALFELKSEIVRYGHEAVRKVAEWRSGLSRFSRSERLAAAHAVLVISSYFEALEEAVLPVPLERLRISGEEQAALAAGRDLPRSYVELISLLVREPLPMPEPHLSYAETRARIGNAYADLSNRLLSFVRGLAVWDGLDDGQQRRLRQAITEHPALALGRYDDAYRRLAADNREFEVWASLTEAHALGAGLSRVATLLTEMAALRPGDRPRAHLLKSYKAGLSEPVLAAVDAPEGLVLPPLGEAYVNPCCRVAEVGPKDVPAALGWWAERPEVSDVEAFFAGFVTSPRATTAPLVVLGEPGSGKSKLTEVLAARLPDSDFLTIRVELRDVASESLVQEQIEQAIYRGLGERVTWHDLLEAANGALPVVLLDGFDELLQATGANRYDYLEQVRDFQRNQAKIDHPLVVIVTSRTIVADRARFPIGTVALQLQPFTEAQVQRWLDVWSRYNATALRSRGLRALPAETALVHRELAEQPLLLLMLAIFDATQNALQRSTANLGRAELYEALLTDFALREVRKSARNRSLPDARQRALADRELYRLAVVALAMFTRGRQSVSDTDLNLDLPALFPGKDEVGTDQDAALSPAQRATGRFFFIHKSEALARDSRTRSYEFLHSTFGEFLIAWLLNRALRDLTGMRDASLRGSTAAGDRLDDGFLFAVLSFSCLVTRRPVIDFLAELLTWADSDQREPCLAMVTELLADSLYPHPSRSHQDYAPVSHPIPRRLAAFSANLVVILVLMAGEVSCQGLFGEKSAIAQWREYAHLWHGALTLAEWDSLVDTIRVRVSRSGESIDIHLKREDGSPVSLLASINVLPRSSLQHPTPYDVFVSYDETISYDIQVRSSSTAGHLIREVAYLPNWRNGMILLQTVPFTRAVGQRIRWEVGDNTEILPGYILAHLDHTRGANPNVRASFYRHCFDMTASYPELCEHLLRRMREDARILRPATVTELLHLTINAQPSELYIVIVNELWRRLSSLDDRQLVIELVEETQKAWPDLQLDILDPELASTVRNRSRQA